MIAYIRDNKWIHLDQLTQGAEEDIINHFSVRSPRARFIDTRAGWDGWYRRYQVSKQRLALPYLDELKKCCDKNGIPLEICDERGAPKYPSPRKEDITEDFIDGIKLEGFQVEALHAACDNPIGIIHWTTGSGKTEAMCGIVKMFRCPTVIVTEQIVVLEQVVERLKLRNVVHNDDVGLFCHGNQPDGNLVIVGSIQSLLTPKERKLKPTTKEQAIREGTALAKKRELPDNFPEELREALYQNPDGIAKLTGNFLKAMISHTTKLRKERAYSWYRARMKNSRINQDMVKKCDLLMVDECDRSVSDMYRPLYQYLFNGYRRYGFSGTPEDKDKPVEALFLRERLGSVIASVDREVVTGLGRIIPIRYVMLAYGEDGDKHDAMAYDIAEKEIICENTDFHDKVAEIVAKFPDDKTLVLLDTSAIEIFGKMLEQVIPNSKFIWGKTSKTERRKHLKKFEDGELKCLIGGKIIKRGLDLKGGAHNLIICGGGSKVSNYDQMIGRALRINDRRYARVFGFLFLNNKYLYKHSRAQLKAVAEMGYSCQVVVAGQVLDGKKFIKSRFRIPRRSLFRGSNKLSGTRNTSR